MKKVVLLLLFLYVVNICHGGLGSPELNISASVSPNPIKKGTSGVLTVNVNEVGGQDWAKNVVVKAYSPDEGIIITPQVSSPVNISKYGSASYTFNVNVDNTASTGVKTIDLELDYIDTGWLNIGDYPHSKSYVMTFNVVSPQSFNNEYSSTSSTYYDNEGYISISSNVADAEVYVDGTYIGTTPITDYSVDSGSHTISVEKEGYNSNSKTLYVESGKYYDLDIPLSESKAYLNIYSSPQDANVYIDGQYAGQTPLYLTITTGEHSIEISKNNYYSYTNSFTLYSGDTKTINVELTPKFGYLTIYSLEGAGVYIDGKYVGHPPIRNYKLSVGTHTIKVYKNDYTPYSTDVYIGSGDTKTINAKLIPKFGYLSVYSYLGIPCDVYVNNVWIGTTPLSKYKISSGTYDVECKVGDLPVSDYSLQVNNGGSDTIGVDITNSYVGYYLGGLLALITIGGLTGTIMIRKKKKSKMTSMTAHNMNNPNVSSDSDINIPTKNKSKTTTTRNIKKTTTSLRTTTNNEKSNPKSETKPKSDLKSDLKSANTTQKIANIPDFPKELLYKYIPLQKIGEGGFGKIFKVKRKSYDKIMAIKTPVLDERAKKYLIKEIKAWKNLDHPNIVKMFNAYAIPTPHIEMEYIDGYNLNGKQIRDLEKYPKPTNPKEALKLIKQIAEGLKHAHDKNIIHRDIKPSNILLTQNLTPKITDWGLAKIGAKSSTATTTKGLTLLYSAPEQIDEEEYGKTDKRTDIYQLGLLFYELLTGKLPYEGNSPTQISLKIVNPDKKPLPPSKINPSLSVFDGLFEKLLAKKKEDRFQSIDELLDTLNSLEKITKEKEELKNTLIKTTQKLKTSTDKKEIEKLTRDLINSTTKLALNCAKINDKVGLLEALEILKDYAKSDENKKELNRAISEIEYSIKEGIPLGSDTVNKLNVLLNRIERDWI